MPPTVVKRGGPARPAPSQQPFGFGRGKGEATVVGRAAGLSRHRKHVRDTIKGITKPAIRRMARRGGVKRISAGIYNDVRSALRERLTEVLRLCVMFTEYRGAKTVTIHDVSHSLRRLGTAVYGFDGDFSSAHRKSRRVEADFEDAVEEL